MDRILTVTLNLCQSGPGNNENEGVLQTLKIPKTRASQGAV